MKTRDKAESSSGFNFGTNASEINRTASARSVSEPFRRENDVPLSGGFFIEKGEEIHGSALFEHLQQCFDFVGQRFLIKGMSAVVEARTSWASRADTPPTAAIAVLRVPVTNDRPMGEMVLFECLRGKNFDGGGF